jgi:hypothetical protein
MPTATLSRPRYDEDFHLWALDQAARLRAMAEIRPNEPIDWELLAEEVEDLGRSERHACESWVEQIIAHLLKLEHSTLTAARGHWRGEIAAFRADLRRKLTPSIERLLRQGFPDRWTAGRERAIQALAEDEPGLAARLPAEPAYGLDQVIGSWLPPPTLRT